MQRGATRCHTASLHLRLHFKKYRGTVLLKQAEEGSRPGSGAGWQRGRQVERAVQHTGMHSGAGTWQPADAPPPTPRRGHGGGASRATARTGQRART